MNAERLTRREQRRRLDRQLGRDGGDGAEGRRAAIDAIARMRRDGLSLSPAAQAAGTTPLVVRHYAAAALEGTKVKSADRLLRPLTIISDGEVATVRTRGSRVASLVGRHHAALRHYLNTGDTRDLQRFAGKKVAGRTLETSPDVIDALARRGEFRMDEIYRLTS